MSKWAKSQNELGYISEGEPTDAQLKLQDAINSAVQNFFDEMRTIYSDASGQILPEVEHDIDKISQIREKTEILLQLPDIY